MNGSNQENLLLLTDATSKGGPPATDTFYSERALLRAGLFDSVKLGVAIGLAWALMFLLVSLIVLFSGQSAVLELFELIYPGMDLQNSFTVVSLGLVFSFVYGFVFGLITGVIYNSFVRRSVLESESFETFV
ncbi:hypothetical protein KJ068_19075 [bacterium]|nr:hypothetical protein [bacterium]RIK81200.1 MAG: hypothetical protein DCC62_02660 [candidate division KSB1 bacterium]